MATAENDLETRQRLLLDLHRHLVGNGLHVTIRRPHNGIWKLKIRRGLWTETVMCAGAEGAYAFVTPHGRLLGSTDDLHGVIDLVQFMVNRRQR
ncbi:hypothetical protein [Actinocorallia aurantiaca]|uniref:Immunity protein 35 of polymorphic toxin system n=1 Tax=Actinocorallia aurantiaca TaxID=46204 RepID=A0ABN3UF25_9ACTN